MCPHYSPAHLDKQNPRVTEHQILTEQRSPSFPRPVDSGRINQDPKVTPSLLKRIGTWGVWVILGSIPLVLGTLGSIFFLWSSNSDNRLWHIIVLAGWVPRSVTLASLVIRWAVAAQSAICASMLAALALHCHGVLLSDSAAVSIMRHSNTGPHSLAICLTKILTTGRVYSIWFLVCLISLTTLASQFTSTLLLSELWEAAVVSNPHYATLYNEIDDTEDIYVFGLGYSYWTTKPAVHPTFAEYTEPGYQMNSIYDTGKSFRALLPIQSQATRSSLRSFVGSASVVDTRVVCVKPSVDVVLAITGQFSEGQDFIAAVGNLGISKMPRNPYFGDFNQSVAFNCTAPLPGLTSAAAWEWRVAMCPLTQGLSPDKLKPAMNPNPFSYTAFLVLNATGSFDGWFNTINASRWTTESGKDSESNVSNEWAFIRSAIQPDVSLGLSLCFNTLATVEMPIEASDGRNHTEAEVSWDIRAQQYDTLAIRQSLGAVTTAHYGQNPPESLPSPASRGHLQMSKPDPSAKGLYGSSVNWGIFGIALSDTLDSQSIFFCTQCYQMRGLSQVKEVNPVISAIFNDIIRLTNRPALAIQALVTTLTGMVYYDFLQLFDVATPATYITYQTALTPTEWTGFKVVAANLGLHFILLGVIVSRFAVVAKESLIGNVWAAVSQLVNTPETDEWLAQAFMKQDEEVRKELKRIGHGNILVGIGLEPGQEGVRLRRR